MGSNISILRELQQQTKLLRHILEALHGKEICQEKLAG